MYVDKLRVRKVGIEAIHDTFYGYIACHSVTTASLHVLVDDAAEWNPFCITTGRSMSGGGESLDVRRRSASVLLRLLLLHSSVPGSDSIYFNFPVNKNQSSPLTASSSSSRKVN